MYVHMHMFACVYIYMFYIYISPAKSLKMFQVLALMTSFFFLSDYYA